MWLEDLKVTSSFRNLELATAREVLLSIYYHSSSIYYHNNDCLAWIKLLLTTSTTSSIHSSKDGTSLRKTSNGMAGNDKVVWWSVWSRFLSAPMRILSTSSRLHPVKKINKWTNKLLSGTNKQITNKKRTNKKINNK